MRYLHTPDEESKRVVSDRVLDKANLLNTDKDLVEEC